MAMVTIAGYECPDPSSLSVSYLDISTAKSGRDELGTMHKMLVARKKKFQLGWKQLTPEEAQAILNAAESSSHVSCTLYNVKTGQMESGTYTVGDRNMDMQQWLVRAYDAKLYKTVSFDLIEV